VLFATVVGVFSVKWTKLLSVIEGAVSCGNYRAVSMHFFLFDLVVKWDRRLRTKIVYSAMRSSLNGTGNTSNIYIYIYMKPKILVIFIPSYFCVIAR
jgi:hypothetical protein